MFSGHRTAEVRKKGRVVSANTDNISTLDQPLGDSPGWTVGTLGIPLRRSLLCILQCSERMTRLEEKFFDPWKFYPFCSLFAKIGATQIALLEL